MVRRHAHLAAEHLAPDAERLSPSREVDEPVRQNNSTNLAEPHNEKSLHRCKPLNEWRARQDSNPRPLGS